MAQHIKREKKELEDVKSCNPAVLQMPNIANICMEAMPSKDTVNNIPSRDKPSIVIPEIAKNLG